MSSLACEGCIEAMTPSSAKRRDVLLAHDLGVLDPQARVARLGDGLPCGGVGVEHQGVALVADGVGATCQPCRERFGRRRLERPWDR